MAREGDEVFQLGARADGGDPSHSGIFGFSPFADLSPTDIFPLRSVSEFPIERCLAEIIKLLRRYLTVGAIR